MSLNNKIDIISYLTTLLSLLTLVDNYNYARVANMRRNNSRNMCSQLGRVYGGYLKDK